MAGIIVNSMDHEIPKSICLMTSKGTPIENAQYTICTKADMDRDARLENDFVSKYHGEPASIYNCHGMTFASRRTGVFDNEMINIILKDEYREIRDKSEVLVGDVVIYSSNIMGITHSSVVVEVKKDGFQTVIRVLSKSRMFKEILHYVDNIPRLAYGTDYKFYRINHGTSHIALFQ